MIAIGKWMHAFINQCKTVELDTWIKGQNDKNKGEKSRVCNIDYIALAQKVVTWIPSIMIIINLFYTFIICLLYKYNILVHNYISKI